MTEAIDIGSRLELFVDDHIVDRLSEVTQTMHRPVPQDVVMRFDRPWEGNSCNYISVIEDGGVYHMYYHGSNVDYTQGNMTNRHAFVCYAESTDGVRWERLSLGLVEFRGSTRIWKGPSEHMGKHWKATAERTGPFHRGSTPIPSSLCPGW